MSLTEGFSTLEMYSLSLFYHYHYCREPLQQKGLIQSELSATSLLPLEHQPTGQTCGVTTNDSNGRKNSENHSLEFARDAVID